MIIIENLDHDTSQVMYEDGEGKVMFASPMMNKSPMKSIIRQTTSNKNLESTETVTRKIRYSDEVARNDRNGIK